jgi:membrane-associated protein
MTELINLFMHFVDIFIHLDQHLVQWIQFFGPWIYVILFLIIFAETGLVVTPFLPGDSLLFAIGALTVMDGGLDLTTILITLIIAGILGDGVNYHIGKYFGPKVFEMNSRFIKREHLEQTQKFYERFGNFTIVAARYAPIVRTFAPFIAGVAKMNYRNFLVYNVVGAVSWVCIFVFAGHYFGNTPFVKKNFQMVILAIIIISIMPFVIQYLKHKFGKKTA